MNKTIFVYGTLKLGYHNNRLLENSLFVGKATTVLKYPMIASGIPFLYNRPGIGNKIKGELFTITDPAVLARVDRLEGHPDWYRREPIEVTLSENNNSSMVVEAYFCQAELKDTEYSSEWPAKK